MRLRRFSVAFLAGLAWALVQMPAASFSQAPAAAAAAAAPVADAPEPSKLEWHDVIRWGVEGRAWEDLPRQRWFARFPDEAEGKVTPKVWELSQESAGMMVRFKTDATVIWANYALRSEVLAKPHMPATGVSGVDLYARDEQGRWRWVNVTKPGKQKVRMALASGLKPGMREYAAYLPLFNGVESLEIGVNAGAKFEGLAPRREKPIVFYGTSITHGACASRPGMTHVALIGRHLEWPVLNLGFAGAGKMDAAVGELLTKVDAAVYVIDCLPNMGPAEVRQKCAPLVKQIRAARPETPIVLVEDRRNTNSWIFPERDQFHTANHAGLRRAYEALIAEGVTNLHYLPGDALLGDDAEGATDGSHPNDLGFTRQATAFEAVLKPLLKK